MLIKLDWILRCACVRGACTCGIRPLCPLPRHISSFSRLCAVCTLFPLRSVVLRTCVCSLHTRPFVPLRTAALARCCIHPPCCRPRSLSPLLSMIVDAKESLAPLLKTSTAWMMLLSFAPSWNRVFVHTFRTLVDHVLLVMGGPRCSLRRRQRRRRRRGDQLLVMGGPRRRDLVQVTGVKLAGDRAVQHCPPHWASA